jgi:hypothetical protein
MTIAADWKFAIDSGEFPGSMTKALRYVAAINPNVSRVEFIEALVKVGLNRNTLGKQFGLSRKFDVEAYGVKVDAEGRELE